MSYLRFSVRVAILLLPTDGFCQAVSVQYQASQLTGFRSPNQLDGDQARAHRLFQFDDGGDCIPRPVGSSACCRYVDNANDRLFLLPIGGRLVLGPTDGRWAFGFGGGGAYMNHHVGNKALDITPGASGGGWYALVSGSTSLAQGSRFSIGGTARWYRFALDGVTPGRFLTVGPQLTFRF